MFSGIIRQTAKIAALNNQGANTELVLETSPATESVLGDSISVSGVCLTVTKIEGDRLFFDIASETLRKTKLGTLEVGSRVNVETSLSVGEKIHGHFVQGHVDTTARLLKKSEEGSTLRLEFSLPALVRGLVAPKGSICIDGVSLTVGEVEKEAFSVYIIPYTLSETTLADLAEGAVVNIEADCLARYVRELLKHGQ